MSGSSELDLIEALALRESKSQLGQDIFALHASSFKQSGTFLEIGAADGVVLSNTYLLEKYFNWSGVLCEPAKGWQELLKVNRTAHLVFDAIWSESDEYLDFREVSQMEFSGFTHLVNDDMHGEIRSIGNDYKVKTLSLTDLLQNCNIPNDLDYFSIDTEGSEFQILKNVDFGVFRPKVITIEHNFTENRVKIYDFLLSFGYKRCHEELSKWDDWYTL